MYARAYNNDSILIPESYGGTALLDGRNEDVEPVDSEPDKAKNRWDDEVHTSTGPTPETSTKSSFLSKLPFLDFLPNIFKSDTFGLQKIGLEEILILATAAFLLFSKDGDKECAAMLLLILFLG